MDIQSIPDVLVSMNKDGQPDKCVLQGRTRFMASIKSTCICDTLAGQGSRHCSDGLDGLCSKDVDFCAYVDVLNMLFVGNQLH